MKRIGMISTVVLSLALGVATPAYALQEQHDQQEEQKAKPAQEEKKAQPEKSAKPEQKPAAQQKTAKPEEKNAQKQSKDTKSEQKNAQQQEKNTKNAEKPAQQQHAQQQPAQQQHPQQAQPGKQEQRASSNGGGGRIPEDRFKANFGEQHRFRVTQADYSTNHRFQYGGYWFGFAAPWPSNWLYTQDVYVIEINGVYYLCNPMYPGVNVALAVSL